MTNVGFRDRRMKDVDFVGGCKDKKCLVNVVDWRSRSVKEMVR